MSVARGLVRAAGNARLRKRAQRLGMIPPQNGFLGIGNLSSGEIRGIANVWVHYFPLHIVPHIYFGARNVYGTVRWLTR
jgi:hypothetical protein